MSLLPTGHLLSPAEEDQHLGMRTLGHRASEAPRLLIPLGLPASLPCRGSQRALSGLQSSFHRCFLGWKESGSSAKSLLAMRSQARDFSSRKCGYGRYGRSILRFKDEVAQSL